MSATPLKGRFGVYGGQYVPETLMSPLAELESSWATAWADPTFQSELQAHQRDFVGRPTPLYFAERLSKEHRNRIHLKREDLCHTGAHKLNNALGQALLARRMGKHRIVAETGAGQHGVATATVCARFGFACTVYMGAEDIVRQNVNVQRMRMLGAEVREVTAGTRTLKDATSEAIRDWVTNVDSTHYIIGSAVGPHPYPEMVRDLQRVIGDDEVRLVGVEAGGSGLATGKHAAPLSAGRPGVLHGALSYLLQDADGQILPTHSISAGLDYPGVGPEHSHLRDSERAEYVTATDEEAVTAFRLCTRLEGIMPALEPAHALHVAGGLEGRILVCLSGRGDKDMANVSPQ